MSVELSITPLDDANGFVSAWRDLYQRAGKRSFFQSPEWIDTWIRQAKDKAELHVVRATQGGMVLLLGIVGLSKSGRVPLLSLREARLGEAANEAIDSVYVEYNDFLQAALAQPDLSSLAWRAVFDHFPGIDSFVIRNGTVGCVSAMSEAALSRDFTIRVIREEHSWICPLAGLREDGKTVLSSLSSNSRKQVERSARLYEERGALAIHVPGTPEEWSASWMRLEALHAATWEARGGAGVFANQQLTEFHAALRQNYPDSVALTELRAGDQTLGVLYNFLHEGRVMNYQSGFQYEEDNRLKPGLLTHVMVAQHYLDQGYEIYDMLVGDVRYKQSLGEMGERMSLVEAVRPGWRQSAVSLARSVRESLKRQS
ncbi:GNAT family N-acetyltransferase [Parvularcula flava]|uniref:GNAT family N-acetyltransferase n=1 Tax=Aquisalinus luteolus TaxID=1566827 RepID=A0A8J3A1D6_9PROT|nr:GNAT family N-acetyltransferase [Aquisalinus luteolus]NHK27501.1 GNAT family N-acetyltransferase [Aquisalinus luteolus]GGH95628.1 hypothetical protein GCM10011355_12620 [Aquisalinus luteolus]